MPEDDARIALTEEEALVVFELLSRWQEAKEPEPMQFSWQIEASGGP